MDRGTNGTAECWGVKNMERELFQFDLGIESYVWALIDEYFPSLANTARELKNHVDGPTLFPQIVMQHWKWNRIDGFIAQLRIDTKEVLATL